MAQRFRLTSWALLALLGREAFTPPRARGLAARRFASRGSKEIYACEWIEANVAGAARDGVRVELQHPSLPAQGFVAAERIDLPREMLPSFFKDGDQVHVRVLGAAGGELMLSMQGGAEAIKADLEAQLRSLQGPTSVDTLGEQEVSSFQGVSQWMEGRVVHTASYGVYVSVTAPDGTTCWGLVHLSELEDGLLPQTALLSVRVAALDVAKGRLLLSAKGDGEEAGGEWLRGSVKEVESYGLKVSTALGCGLLYATELDEEVLANAKVGDELRVRSMGEMEEGVLALSMKSFQAEEEQSQEASPEEEEPLPSAQDLQLRAMRERLKDYLGVSPRRPLKAQVQAETPFGLLLDVAHPDGAPPAQGLLAPGDDVRPGQELDVRIISVDTHRGVLMVART